jgi:hypothetical protein
VHSGGIEILRRLRDVIENSSRNEIPKALKSQAEYYFGSLRNALAALKKDKRLARAWSKRKIIAMLSRLHRAKKNLAYSEARGSFQPIVSAAEAYFGSWGKALHAAGIDPNLYLVSHTWRK